MTREPSSSPQAPWWQSAVIYQIYLRSFADSNGDGIGDLKGVIEHLDHLEWLGVDAIWLSPITVSPDADWGYDVADYYAVQPEIGTMAQFDQLVELARERKIRVLLDLVPNHTSDQHPWFTGSRSSKEAPTRDWYVWADPKLDGGTPNNWVSSFGGPAWTLDPQTAQYFLHNHLPAQPDLNWWNDEVRDEFDSVMRFWLDRGVAGFRIDVCNVIIKDAELRDNPPATEDDDFEAQLFGQRAVYNCNRPEVHEVIRRWRAVADSYAEPRLLVGETPVPVEQLAGYYGNGTDELHLAFNFPFITSEFDPVAMRKVVDDTQAHLPVGAWPAWTGSNHDMSRFSSRWAGGDVKKARLALMMLLCLRGTPVLYQGDEIGLCDSEVAHEDMRDPLGVLYWPAYAGRDAMRTPMPWRDVAGGGFTDPASQPWLPLSDTSLCNVEDQSRDPESTLSLTRGLISLRKRTEDLLVGRYQAITTPEGVWGWNRGNSVLVVLNMKDAATELVGISGRIMIGTSRSRDRGTVDGTLGMEAWEGLVVDLRAE